MSRHFCFCIPVRVAVFCSSLIAFLLTGAASGVALYAYIQSQNQQNALSLLTSQQKTAALIFGIVYAIVTICCLFGFIGSIIRNLRLVSIYAYMSYLIFFLEAISSIYGVVNLYRNKDGICGIQLGSSDLHNGDKGCLNFDNTGKAVVVAFIVIILLFQLYIIIIIRRYVQQLTEEQSYDRASKYAMGTVPYNNNNSSGSYYAHTPMLPTGGYAYAEPQNSFGSRV